MNDSIIFDLDGTIWNSCPNIAKAWNKAFNELELKITITAKDIENVAGKPYKECTDIILRENNKKEEVYKKHPDIVEILNKYEENELKESGGVYYKNAIEGIKELSKRYKVFIVSNCQDWYLELFFGKSKLKKHLSGYDCNGMSHLPKSEMLKNMKEKYKLKNPVYIGDTLGDEKSTYKADLDFIHVSYGFGTSESKKTKIVDSFSELLEYFSVNS